MRKPAACLAVIAMLGAGCVAAVPGQSAVAPTATAGGPPPSRSASPPPTAARSTSLPATTAGPSPVARPTVPVQEGPAPAMYVVLPDGERLAGVLGSHCWGRGCGDGPAPPAEQLPMVRLPAGTVGMAVEIEGDVGFVHWSADYRADGSDDGSVLGEGGAQPDPDAAFATPQPVFFVATFDSPPSGDWVVTLSVNYHGGGDALYFWHVVVP